LAWLRTRSANGQREARSECIAIQPTAIDSLRQSISDGFLAPHKVVRIGLDKDLDGLRPTVDHPDRYRNVIKDREYNERDYDCNLILEKRTELVAAKISEFLTANGRYAKTIVFCENIDHAERMRQVLVNANPDLAAANNTRGYSERGVGIG
jgi:type I restriction enzyme R subunit